LFEAIEKAAAAGAQGVEVFEGQSLSPEQKNIKVGVNMPAESITALLEHAKKHSIAVVNFGVVDIPNNEAAARKFFEFGKALGVYGITTESLGALDLLEKLSQEYDMKVCFHNHPKPTPLWNPDTVFNALKGRHANIGYCADLGHWASSGLNPLDVIKKIAPHVHSFHMKDRASLTGPTHDQEFGTGLVANMLGKPEEELPFGEHALDAAVGGLEDRDIERGGGMSPAERGGKDQSGDWQDTEQEVFCFHGCKNRKWPGVAVWGEIPNPQPRAGFN
jgi:sugar phosphate isomerase/epimerase